jgi:hypothetical protein
MYLGQMFQVSVSLSNVLFSVLRSGNKVFTSPPGGLGAGL